MNEARLREEICWFGKSIYDRGLTAGSSGNISARAEDGWIMSPTNACLGRLDPARPVRLDAGNRSPGPVGLSLFHDDAQVSARDLVTLMLTISDNVATDALLALVGLDAVAAAAERHGLADTRVGCDLQGLLDSVARDVGFADWAAL